MLDRYRIPSGGSPDSSVEVTITDIDSVGRYGVASPPLDKEEQAALEVLRRDFLDVVPPEASGTPEDTVKEYLWPTAERAGVADTVRRSQEKLAYYLLREFAGFWELDPLMKDEKIEEVSVTRADKNARLLHRGFSEYMFLETNVGFESEARLQAFIRRLAQFGGTTVSLAQPSLEVTLHGASDVRITATLGDEISRPGSTFAIRKQRQRPLTLAHLASPERPGGQPTPPAPPPGPLPTYEEVHLHKTLSVLMAAYFWLLLERTTNVLVAGETNSGKTTLMNAILGLIDPKSKIVTAEDVLEINLPDHLHWERLKTRSYRAGLSPSTGRFEYDLSDLLKLALRFSPTVLSLGEMRGEESETVAAAITLGHSTMTTVHAESAERCVQRLTTPPMKFAEGHVRDITAIATMKRTALADGRVARRVVSVDEIRPVGGDAHEIVNVFRYDYTNDSFFPMTPAEVVDRSYRLSEISRGLGWSPAKLQGSLTLRAAYISKTIQKGDFSALALSTMVREFLKREKAADPSR